MCFGRMPGGSSDANTSLLVKFVFLKYWFLCEIEYTWLYSDIVCVVIRGAFLYACHLDFSQIVNYLLKIEAT